MKKNAKEYMGLEGYACGGNMGRKYGGNGSGSQKYCVCHHDDTRQCLGHVHLTCLRCHRTFCLPNIKIPPVMLPEGFIPEEAEYVVKGICAQCATSSHFA